MEDLNSLRFSDGAYELTNRRTGETSTSRPEPSTLANAQVRICFCGADRASPTKSRFMTPGLNF